MKIYAFQATEDHAPSGQFVARIYLGDVRNPKSGAMVPDWHPILFSGTSEGSVRLAAQTWWENELAKREAKAAPRKKAPEPTPESVVTVDEDFDVL